MEEKFYKMNETNETLNSYFYMHHHHSNNHHRNYSQHLRRPPHQRQESSVEKLINMSKTSTLSPTPVPRKKQINVNNPTESYESKSSSSRLLVIAGGAGEEVETTSTSSSSSSSNCSREQQSSNDLLLMVNADSRSQEASNYLEDCRLSRPPRPPLPPLRSTSTTLPRRSSRSRRHKSTEATASTLKTPAKKVDVTNDALAQNPNLYCFVNTSYAVSTLNSHTHMIPYSQSTLKTATSTLRTERLQRPSAPPPPPPPPPPPVCPNIGPPQLTSTPARRHFQQPLALGFEPLLQPCPSSSQSQQSQPCYPAHSLRLKAVKNPAHFDLAVLVAALCLFAACILAISVFQWQANQFYLKFMNMSSTTPFSGSNISGNATSSAMINDDDLELAAAGSELVKQTILVCNGPWFSYQMNNLLVLPFSLALLIAFSFLQKSSPQSYVTRKKYSSKFPRPHLPSGLDPFQRRNRFLVAALFCILANEIFKMIESSMFVSTPTATTSTFNSTSQLFQSVFFSSSSSQNISSQHQLMSAANFSTSSSSGADLLRIGLGIEPEQLVQQRSRLALLGKTTKQATTSKPLVVYSKPKLRPKLNIDDLEPLPDSGMVINLRLDVGEHVNHMRHIQNKSMLVASSLNASMQNSSSQTLFEFSMSLYRNQYVQSALHKLAQSCLVSELKWSLVWSRLETIALILVEVLVIGLRYYPLMGVLDPNNRTICIALAAVYMWFDVAYNIAITGLCEGLRLNVSFEVLKEVRAFFGVGSPLIEHATKKSSAQQIDTTFLFSPNRIIYTLVKSLPHFFCLAYVTMRLTCACVLKAYQLARGKIATVWQRRLRTQQRNLLLMPHTKSTTTDSNENECILNEFIVDTSRQFDLVYKLASKGSQSLDCNKRKQPLGHGGGAEWMELSFEDRYIRNLLKAKKTKYSNKYFRLLIKLVDTNFRYSIRTVCTYTVCFTVLYYFTCFFCFYSSIFIDLIYFPPVYKHFLTASALLTSIVCFTQLAMSLRQFKHHLKSMYAGGGGSKKKSTHEFASAVKIATASFNYAGYAVTYTCWGYIIMFAVISFVGFQAATLVVFSDGGLMTLILLFAIIVLPFVMSVLLVRLLNKCVASAAARFCFLQRGSRVLALKNRRLYSLFLYFKFFYDCFAGLALCLVRLVTAIVLALVYMTRLDRPLLVSTDAAHSAYLGYLCWEAVHTNPTLVGFCDLITREARFREARRREERKNELGLPTLWRRVVVDSSTNHNRAIRARTRWFLIYTLLNNTVLISARKRKRN